MKKMTKQGQLPAKKKTGTMPILLFLLAELVLYILLLFAGGQVAVISSFASVVLCFAFGLAYRGSGLMVAGLAMTVAADVCLVLCSPRQQFIGMVFFLIAQSLYAVKLHRERPSGKLLVLRVLLVLAAFAVCVLALRENTDVLALISLCYYANLLMNIVAAFCAGRKNCLLAIGFVLFLMCDTVIGLQEAAKGYLAMAEDTLLYKLLFMDFNLPWVFYLPSQVCIALSSRRR